MRIKAAEMEQMFGMSPNGIRLYEKYGIIRPERKGSYRVYGQEEMRTMGWAIQLRRYGFSMPETAQLLCGADSAEQISALRRRSDELEAEIGRLSRLRKSIRVQTGRMARAQALLDDCDVEEKPAMYFLGIHRNGKLVDARTDALAGEWISRYSPHLSSAALLDGPYFTGDASGLSPLYGIAVDAEVALELGLHQSEHILYLPPKPCVVTAVRETDDLTACIARVRAFAERQRLSLHAGGLLRLVSCAQPGGERELTWLLWAPIAGNEHRFGGMV